jgi:pimeloyl-ACP methyl ester carboxylesterase
MIDRGSGVPVVFLPGIHGRWEWMAPTVNALASKLRVIAFSLCDEPTSGFHFDEQQRIDAYVEQVNEAMRRANVERALIVGVSYSGLAAMEFAGRFPERVLGLVLASALPPRWQPDGRAKFFMRAPRLLSPLFWMTSPARMLPEIVAALPLRRRLPFLVGYGYRAVRWPVSVMRMARRLRWVEAHEFCEPSRITAPVLVITGEDRLDRVVPTSQTREYVACLPQARHVTFKGTGHIGLVTKPAEFADLVCQFANEISSDAARIPA